MLKKSIARARHRKSKQMIEGLESRTLLSIALNNGVWTSIGPAPILNGQTAGNEAVSGQITSVVTDPSNANIYYAAARGGGVWKSTDAGFTWAPLTDDQPTQFIGALAISASDSRVIYAGTGNSDLTYNSYYGQGILRSEDGGVSWTLLAKTQFYGQSIAKIAIDPTNPQTLYAAVNDGAVNGVVATAGTATTGGDATPPAGIYKSTDGGVTWTNTTGYFSTDDQFYDVEINPSNPLNLYSTFTSSTATNGQGGIYESVDGGNTWALVTNITAPSGVTFGSFDFFGRISLAFAPDEPSTIYAAIENNFSGDLGGDQTDANPGFLVKTVDGGASWTLLTGVPQYGLGDGFYNNSIAVDPLNPDVVYLGGSTNGTLTTTGAFEGGIITSHDGGTTWTDITIGSLGNNGPRPGFHSLTFTSDDKLLAGTDSGMWQLANPTLGSILWDDLNTNLNDTAVISTSLDPTNTSRAFSGVDQGGIDQFSGRLSWTQSLANFGGRVVIDPSDPNIVYSTLSDNATFVEKSTDGGVTWNVSNTGIVAPVASPIYIPIVIDPNNNNRLLLATDEVYESVDAGTTWTAISSPGTNGWDGGDEAIDTVDTGDAGAGGAKIYAGTTGGHLYVTSNDGQTWTEIDPPTTVNIAAANIQNELNGLPDETTLPIDQVTVDPTNSNIAYVVIGGFTSADSVGRTDASGGKIFETTDGGTTWSDVSGVDTPADNHTGAASPGLSDVTPGTLPNVPFHTMVEYPSGVNGFLHTLYVGGDDGVYVSYNDGGSWSKFGAGLPTVDVESLTYDSVHQILAASTYGRGVWEISTAFPGATIGNFVFNDLNADGIKDGTEPGVANVAVYLYSVGNDGVQGTSDDTLLATTVTNSEGAYSFTNVASGTDYIHAVAPPGYSLSPQYTAGGTETVTNANGTTSTVDIVGSTVSPFTGNSAPFTVISNTVSPTIDTGMYVGVFAEVLGISSPVVTRDTANVVDMVFTITLSPANPNTFNIPYTTADGTGTANVDYTPESGTLYFTQDVTSLTVTVPILPSAAIDPDKTVLLNVTLPGTLSPSSNSSGTGMILSNVVPVVGIASNSITRDPISTGFLPFTITLSTPAPFVTSIIASTQDGSASQGLDYQNTTQTFTFQPGQTSDTFYVLIYPGTNAELDRSFTVILSSPGRLDLDPNHTVATGTIVSNVEPSVTIQTNTITESIQGGNVLPVTVAISNSISSTFTVDYTTADGTAVAGVDYTTESGTLTFTPGKVSQTIDIPVSAQYLPAQDKQFSVILSNLPAGLTLAQAGAVETIVYPALTALPFSAKQRATYLDNLDHRVTVSLRGAGSGDVVFVGGSASQADAYEIVTNGTTTGSSVTIAVAGGAQTSINTLQVNGSLDLLTAKTTNVTGVVNLTGSAYAITLGYLAAAPMTIGGGGSGQAVGLTFNRVLNSSITSAIPIRFLTAGAYLDTTGSPIYVTAPSIGKVKVRGNLGATLQSNTVAAVQVAGAFTGSILATDSIGSVIARSITGSSILAGVASDLVGLPASEIDFTSSTSRIGSVRVSGGMFADSVVSSWNVGTVSLQSVDTTGSTGSGVSGKNLGSVHANAGGKVVTIKHPTTSSVFGTFEIDAV